VQMLPSEEMPSGGGVDNCFTSQSFKINTFPEGLLLVNPFKVNVFVWIVIYSIIINARLLYSVTTLSFSIYGTLCMSLLKCWL